MSDEAFVQAMLDVEVALAEAAADAGLVPAASAAAIRAVAVADPATTSPHLRQEAARAGNLAIPLVRHLTRAVAASDAVRG